MKPSFPNWTNPYIDRIESLPELVLPCYEGSPSEEERKLLSSKISIHSESYCEFGSGSGRHLIERAAEKPDSLFIGFELRYKRAFRTAEKAKSRNLENLLVLRCNAHLVFDILAADSLNGVYVNFPDPWDRRRWEKHRMLSDSFLAKLPEVMKNGAFLSYKTDHERRFLETVEMLRNMAGWKLDKVSEDLHSEGLKNDYVKTEFESLFTSKGMRIFHLIALCQKNS